MCVLPFRFLYITTTLHYQSIVTTRKMVLALVLCWILPAINASTFIFTYKYKIDLYYISNIIIITLKVHRRC